MPNVSLETACDLARLNHPHMQAWWSFGSPQCMHRVRCLPAHVEEAILQLRPDESRGGVIQ